MGNLGNFDARTVEPNTRPDCLPAGEYEVCIVASELKPTASGNGHYLKLDLQVLNGEHQNRHIFDNLNIDNPNEQARKIARGNLSSICRAVGVLTPQDSSELHDRPLRAKVKIEKDDEYGAKNKVVAYKPMDAGPSNGGHRPPPATAPDYSPAAAPPKDDSSPFDDGIPY